MGSIFRTEGLSAGYGRKVVLSGAEITAERGRITTLIGPNGCGKSCRSLGFASTPTDCAPSSGSLSLRLRVS